MASPDGFVIGIEGEWGSGKSSFINLVSDALHSTEDAPEIVRFLPWLINSREGLLKELFTEITEAALHIDVDEVQDRGWRKYVWTGHHSQQAERKKKLKKLLSQFSSRLVQAGKLAELSGLVGAGTVVEAGVNAAKEWLGNTSLEKEKRQIQKELRKLKRKIVVLIDDLDRLESNEVAEILRLVRAVVDFPNVIYILCYSREILAKNIATALKIEKGEEFLEKIIQVRFSIPRPEAFDLRRMFRHDLQQLYPDLLDSEHPQSHLDIARLARIIDIEGGRALLTPRHVVRAVNALRFHATPVLENIDIPDMVWLQLIRLQSEDLYE
jgi:predicted KAP-like P-loop ATPase